MTSIKVTNEQLRDLVKAARLKVPHSFHSRPVRPVPQKAEQRLGKKPETETMVAVFQNGKFEFDENPRMTKAKFSLTQLQAWADDLHRFHPEYLMDTLRISSRSRYDDQWPTVEIERKVSDAEWARQITLKQIELDEIYKTQLAQFEDQVKIYKSHREKMVIETKRHLGPLMPAIAEKLRELLELRYATNPQVEVKYDEGEVCYYLEVSSDDERHILGRKMPGSKRDDVAWQGFQIRLAKNNGRRSSIVSEHPKPNDWEKDLELE